jgi:phosphoglycerate dehydrogenase-like enzyme
MPPATRKVVFALSPETKDSLFPQFDELSLQGAEHSWLDISGLSPEAWEQRLRETQPEVLVSGWFTPGLPTSVAESADCPLRYVCHVAGSVRHFLPRRLIERGVLVTNWGAAASASVAEHAILLVLGALRGTSQWRHCMENSITGSQHAAKALNTRSLRGRRVGLHGFGGIAREIASLLQPFGVRISAYSAGVPAQFFAEHGVCPAENLEELFSSSDVFIECEALTPETEGIVTEGLLKLLPDQAVFVNVGRGPILDENALGRLAAEGRIRVALDVYCNEPLPLDSLLLTNPDTLLSPHIGGPTRDLLPSCGNTAIENLRHYLSGNLGKMEGVVTPEIYDRST